ncbi:hypothetical protein MHYP_G00340260 [Metynnis hypsauchen]
MAVESELKCCVSVVLCLAFNHLFLCKDADSEQLGLASRASSGPACARRTKLWSALCPRTPALLDRGTVASPLFAPTFDPAEAALMRA